MKGLVVTGITNKIEYATHNGKGLITGKREDVTKEAIKAVMQQMDTAHKRKKWDNGVVGEYFAYKIDGFGELRFYPSKKESESSE